MHKSRSKSRGSRRSKSRSKSHAAGLRHNDLERMMRWKTGTELILKNIGIDCSFSKFVKPGTSERPLKRIDKYGTNFQIMIDIHNMSSSQCKMIRKHSRENKPVRINNISINWYITGFMGSCNDATIILQQKLART